MTFDVGRRNDSPRDLAIARLIRRLLDTGVGVEGVRMLKRLAERDLRWASGTGDDLAMLEEALTILYRRKAFREEAGMDEEQFPDGRPPPPPDGPPPPPPGGPPGPGQGPSASPAPRRPGQ